ncbi:galactokinase [Nocardia caishijiensis]|uniref:Galactokinase n=1 Tax=Nocardia caishijiensis TaxID=184756 RepID=A0ABQ6YKU9_9NOCA|nr:galactokinase [Nocardia caishijiensis]KAF0846419.1 galactokinase [Nocardia caishijiensis]
MDRWIAPGRVNIIGEHTDYNDGFVLPIALSLGVVCAAQARGDGRVRVGSAQRPGAAVELDLDDLAGQRDQLPGWARYPLGVVGEYVGGGHPITGIDLELDGAVPIGAGLSSSAALCCAVTVALRDLFAPDLDDRAMVEIARAAENDFAGVPSGILDQSASILCTEGHALFLDVRAYSNGESGAVEQIPFDLRAAGLALIVADTGQPHDLGDGEYARRRAECAAAAATLGVHALRDATELNMARLHDPVLRRRATHVVTENDRVLDVVARLCSGADPRAVGPLLTASHRSLRDDFEVSTPALDLAVDAALDAGAYGARMVGGGFGGSVLALVEHTDADRIGVAIGRRFAAAGLPTPRVFPVEPGPGARKLD